MLVVQLSPAFFEYLAWEKASGILDGVQEQSRHLYSIWRGMRERCCNPNHKSYSRYGGSGIAVCPEWASFDAFEAWARSNGYVDGLTLDRGDGTYGDTPANCRWATQKQQARNMRSNVNIDIDGRVMCATDWANEAGLKIGTLLRRYHLGWRGDRLLLPTNIGRRVSE